MKSSKSPSLLVLEDELLYLELVVDSCNRIGFEVLSARTVDEALALMEELKTVDLDAKSVDAIWVDHFLPGKTGSDFIKELLKHKEWRGIPIFLVTNAIEPEIINWYLRAGVKQYFPKISVMPKKIVTDIDLYLQQHPAGSNPKPGTIEEE